MNAKNAVKPTEVTKEAFLAFCESKGRRTRYNPYSPMICAVGQFAAACGLNPPITSIQIDRLLGQGVASAVFEKTHTFGALAARLRQAKAEG